MPVNCLDIEARLNAVSGPMGTLRAIFAEPKPRSRRNRPFCITATAHPGEAELSHSENSLAALASGDVLLRPAQPESDMTAARRNARRRSIVREYERSARPVPSRLTVCPPNPSYAHEDS